MGAKTDRVITTAFVEGSELVLLYRKQEDGRVYAARRQAEYVGYIRKGDVDAALMRELRTSVTIRGISEEGSFYRVNWAGEFVRREFATNPESPLVKAGVEVLEGDVDPVRRYLTDHDVKIVRPRRVYLDIETDSRVSFADKELMRVLSWATVDHETGERVERVLEDDTDKAEKALLEDLWTTLEPYDQVAAWYGDGFDFQVIFARSKLHRCKADARKWLWVDQLEAYKRLNHGGDGDEKRSMRLEDIGQSVTGKGKLKAPAFVVERFGGDKALGALSWDLWEAGGEFRDLLVRYNGQDTDLLREIELKTGYLDLLGSICEVCRLFPVTRSLDSMQQMDGYMLALGRQRDYRFPTKQYRTAAVKFRGAYVMPPLTLDAAWRAERGMRDGIARGVHVCDFSSMYPSVILSWNMGPDTKVAGPVNGPVPAGTCRSPLTGILFRTGEPGILSVAIKELMKLRAYWNDLKATLPPGTPEWVHADHMSHAYKVVVLQFYGGVGSPFSRFFDKQIAESVAQSGVALLKRTLHEAELWKFQVVYGDTDSAFVAGVERGSFVEFVRWCNEELYPGMLKDQGCGENHIKLAYEKEFDRLVLTSAKRYCGSYRHYKWTTTCTCTTAKGQPGALDVKTMRCRDCGVVHDALPPIRSAPEIRGLEYRRGDCLKMAVDLQAHVIDMLVGGLGIDEGPVPTDDLERYHAVLSRVRQRVLGDPLALGDVVMSKSLSRPLKEYASKVKQDGTDAAQPPHVVVAKLLKQRGRDVREGTRVEYFVVDGAVSPMKVLPAEDWKGEFDRFYLWESLVYPPTQRLLEAAYPAHDWAAWAKVRPPKVRKRAGKGADAGGGSLSLPGGEGLATGIVAAAQPTLAGLAPSPGVAQRRIKPVPYEVQVQEGAPGAQPGQEVETMRRLRAVLERHPGSRPVVIVTRLVSGARVAMDVPLAVAPCDELTEEVAALALTRG